MARRLSSNIVALSLATMALAACGSSANFNKIFGGEDDAGDTLIDEAKADYDRGDFAGAASKVNTLLTRNPDNEEAAVLMGYIALSQGGIDPYEVARKLVALSSSTATGTGTGTGTGGTGTGTQAFDDSFEELANSGAGTSTGTTAPNAASSGADATKTLQLLGSLISLSPTDLGSLSLGAFGAANSAANSAANNGGVQPTLFTGQNALLVPAPVTDALRTAVPALAYMNSAIKAVCRFVDPAVKIPDDTRNADSAGCTETSYPRQQAAKANFLWAFSHLGEALIYQQVLLYTAPTNTSGTPSLTAVSATVNQTQQVDAANFANFVNEVVEVKNAINAVFDTSDSNAMLQATLEDLTMVTDAFDALQGLPTSVTSQITGAFSQLNTLSQNLGGNNVSGNTKALKTQFTSTLANGIGSQIDKAADKAAATFGQKAGVSVSNYKDLQAAIAKDPSLANNAQVASYQTQVKTMCTAYTGLTSDIANATKPTACN
jgi:hypothetical protein